MMIRYSAMEWKVIAENCIGALVVFLIYFIPMLLAHCVFDQTGRIRWGFLLLHCVILVLLFLGATFRASLELEEIAREIVISPDEKEALSPQLAIGFNPVFDDPSYARCKYPLYEYCFLVHNRNKQSVPITDLTISFFFKNVINEVKREVMLETGGSTIGGVRYIGTEGKHTTIIEDKPLDIPISRAIVLAIRTRRKNGNTINTNEAVLNSEKWPEGASVDARVVVDVTAKPDLIAMPDKMGTYEGKYHYQIKNKKFEELIDGKILEPNVAMLKAQSHYDKGYDHEKREQYDEAIVEYSQAIGSNPKEHQAYFHRALCYSKKRDYTNAILDNSKAIELSPTYADAYFNRASAHAESKQYDKAIQDYTIYIQMNPQDPEGYVCRGRVLGLKGQNDDAISDFDKAIQLNPNNGNIYYYRALLRSRIGHTKEAIIDMKKACELGIKEACDAYDKLTQKEN